MHLEYLKNEKHWGNDPYRPDLQGKVMEGKRGRILLTIYRAGGAGLHPTVLLSHGIPGLEKNFDLAMGLRRVGFHVVMYHYSGSWNSDGDYSFAHNLEDGETVLEFILRDEEMGFDKEKLYAAGHSMGSFVTAHLAAKRKEIKAAVLLAPCDISGALLFGAEGERQMREIFAFGAPYLSGTTAEQLYAEAEREMDTYKISALAEELAKIPVYCIGASLDGDCPTEVHAKPWVEAVWKAGGNVLYEEWETDHSFSDMRFALVEKVTEFLVEQVNK